MVSVSRIELGLAVVVSVIDARSIDPEFTRSTLRCTESPGVSSVASTSSRLLWPPVAPTSRASVPVENVCVTALVELVNPAYTPMPATSSAITTTTGSTRNR